MTRTRIQLPDPLYRRVKAFAAERELSLAEITRRGIEMFLDRYPRQPAADGGWKLPKVDGGGIRVPLADLKGIVSNDETVRSYPDESVPVVGRLEMNKMRS